LDVYLSSDVGVYGDFEKDALGPISMSWNILQKRLGKEVESITRPKSYSINHFSDLVYCFVQSEILRH